MPAKNRLEIESGMHLVQHAIDCAADSGLVDCIAVSTDDARLDFRRAEAVNRPPELAGPTADISSAVAHAAAWTERRHGEHYDYVVTLQPAVLARSPLIVRRILAAVIESGAGGAVTAARTVPWQWSLRGKDATNAWHPHPYPRSQDSGHHLAEINAVQVARRDAVEARQRWALPLILAELPPWAAALDIDEPADLTMARDMWAWARPRLETWECPIHWANTINGNAT